MDTRERILKLMENNQVTKYRLAKEIGVSSGIISDWANGKSTSYTKYLEKIANYFNVTVDFLLTGSDCRVPTEDNNLTAKNRTEEQLLLLCRRAEDASPEEKDLIVKQFEASIDMYLQARGFKKKED